MSSFSSENHHIEYVILRTIAEYQEPIGAGLLADLLRTRGRIEVSEATVGRYLRNFELRGLLKSEKYEGRSRGRIITPEGIQRVRELAVEQQQAKTLLDTMQLFQHGFGQQLRNLLVVREIIEPEVAALAAENATEEDIEAIRNIVEESGRLTEQGVSMAGTDAPFHIAIAKATGNPVLEAVVKMLRADRDYSPEIESIINSTSQNNPSDHRSIYHAIRDRDSQLARQIMRQHICNLLQRSSQFEQEPPHHDRKK